MFICSPLRSTAIVIGCALCSRMYCADLLGALHVWLAIDCQDAIAGLQTGFRGG